MLITSILLTQGTLPPHDALEDSLLTPGIIHRVDDFIISARSHQTMEVVPRLCFADNNDIDQPPSTGSLSELQAFTDRLIRL